jgi:hypothetical protein
MAINRRKSSHCDEEIITITEVEPLEGLWIRAAFSDGAVKEIDLIDLIGRSGGAFATIRESARAAG